MKQLYFTEAIDYEVTIPKGFETLQNAYYISSMNEGVLPILHRLVTLVPNTQNSPNRS
jgi:hypothetical protein